LAATGSRSANSLDRCSRQTCERQNGEWLVDSAIAPDGVFVQIVHDGIQATRLNG
jgi:hypothetical protein